MRPVELGMNETELKRIDSFDEPATDADRRRFAQWLDSVLCECPDENRQPGDVVCAVCGGTTPFFPGSVHRFAVPYIQNRHTFLDAE